MADVTALTAAAASDLFRRAPDDLLELGGGAGAAAYRKVGTGPDVLLVHGWPTSGATWRRLLPHLADHVTCHVIDFPSAGHSRFDATTTMSIAQHVKTVQRVVDLLGLTDVAVVAHDSGGMISRHALAGDARVRAWGLIDTEPASGVGIRFKMFLANRRLPGLDPAFEWITGKPAVYRNKFVFGDAFLDRSLLDGEFDEFFLRPLHTDTEKRAAAVKLLKSFDYGHVKALGDLHRRITVPVHLVWGSADKFFPVAKARADVATFPDAKLTVVPDCGLFAHEERPAEVAAALLPTLTASR